MAVASSTPAPAFFVGKLDGNTLHLAMKPLW